MRTPIRFIETRFCGKSGHLHFGSLLTQCVAGIAARSRQFARDFADVFGGEIGMIERNRSVDQPDRNFSRPLVRAISGDNPTRSH
jgi:hypothetical protein